MSIKLIVGLGNIGTEYEYTRHNAGFWLIDELAKQWNVSLREEKKFFGDEFIRQSSWRIGSILQNPIQ